MGVWIQSSWAALSEETSTLNEWRIGDNDIRIAIDGRSSSFAILFVVQVGSRGPGTFLAVLLRVAHPEGPLSSLLLAPAACGGAFI